MAEGGTSDKGKEMAGGKKLKPGGRKALIKAQCVVDLPRSELSQLWKNFEDLPNYLPHLVKVDLKSEKESHWTIQIGPNKTVEWDALVTQELDDESISWRSRASSPIEHAGKVHFQSEEASTTSTRLTVSIEFKVPGGKMGQLLVKAIGDDPEHRLQEELDYFKRSVEKHAAEKKH